jgi:hypothetical protein
MLKGDPQAAKEADDLARQMQHLDPKRFPVNPAIVDQMHREMIGSIDRLELQLERSASASLASPTGKPQAYRSVIKLAWLGFWNGGIAQVSTATLI